MLQISFYLLSDAFIFSTLLGLLTLGFNLTYMTSRIPNWAYGTFSAVAIYITFSVIFLWRMNPYYSLIISFFIMAALGVAVYVGVVYVLKKFGAPEIVLLVSTLAIDIILTAFINIYADAINHIYKIRTREFILRDHDITIFGQPGVLVVSIAILVIFVISFSLMLKKTKFGIAMRATVEDPELASVLGVNTDFVNVISWFITGGLAGIAGALLPLWFFTTTLIGTRLILDIMSASILGGIFSLYAAIISSYIVGFSEIIVTYIISIFIPTIGGVSTASYRPVVPLLILSITLLIMPNGLAGFYEKLKERKGKVEEAEKA